MVLVAQVMSEDDELYDCLVEVFLPNLSPFNVVISFLEV
jgi:hypothetical protein